MNDQEYSAHLREIVPVEGSLVRLASVPAPWRDELREYIRMNCIPISNDGGGDAMYAWDWTDWLDGRRPDIP
ncbi:hypothetical protein PQR68_34600 [Paraburkholderia agricolaris]|uniref:hypothetical protein n=1 Tax=Paraburkholderia agricolaris TaxID=2152888 RepID=UPI0038B91DA4